ncbi:hypothetical protein THTE_0493 [Thermogutta terrifontis]|uniref:Uncharacterized protein n=1 Tax=Thermogutta terrifontis TaxID=1331910 RepID=A0A286RAW8_9BACT|nr:hypothetical protein THTE_0493 [Thermogutta terrifontis]
MYSRKKVDCQSHSSPSERITRTLSTAEDTGLPRRGASLRYSTQNMPCEPMALRSRLAAA